VYEKRFAESQRFATERVANLIHPTAIIDPSAELDPSVGVGAYSVIGAGVQIGANTCIEPHVVIKGPTRIGADNHIYQFASLGDNPQDKKYDGEENTFLEIGDRNEIREYCTMNRGTAQGGGITKIGSDNWIMAYTHIAHDCIVGNHTIFANGASAAGHVRIDDHVILGGFTGIHQFCWLGAHSFMGAGSIIFKDVPPYVMVWGNRAEPYGINKEGLKRRGFDNDTIGTLHQAYKLIYKKNLTTAQAIEQLTQLQQETHCDALSPLVEFLQHSTRGIVR
jgi:UDP-N-acetylglucosamine acyltransferase